MAASVWSGYLTFGLISMPVRLFSGARSSGISFNMLHRDDLSRLKQQYVCLEDGKVVERADTVKGYEFRKDEYVVIEPEEIKKIEPQNRQDHGDLGVRENQRRGSGVFRIFLLHGSRRSRTPSLCACSPRL